MNRILNWLEKDGRKNARAINDIGVIVAVVGWLLFPVIVVIMEVLKGVR